MNPSSTSRHESILCSKVPPTNQRTKLLIWGSKPVFLHYCFHFSITRMKVLKLLTAEYDCSSNSATRVGGVKYVKGVE
jgi:hypothetical protein